MDVMSLEDVKLSGMAASLRYALDPVAFAVNRLDWHPDPWQTIVLRATDRGILLQRAPAEPADEAPMFARKAFVAAAGTPK
jgi:hypothetical protein